jgi:hypothetical protein
MLKMREDAIEKYPTGKITITQRVANIGEGMEGEIANK